MTLYKQFNTFDEAAEAAGPLRCRIDTHHSMEDLRRLADVWIASRAGGFAVMVSVVEAVAEPPRVRGVQRLRPDRVC